MPGNQQGGGGPWGGGQGGNGGGPRNPWGGSSRGGRGSGQEPPDLEDIIRRSQDRLKNLPFGGGKGIALLLVILIALWLGSGFYRVLQDERGVVLRFGKFTGELAEPGLNYHLPWPIETVLTPKVTRIQAIEIGFRSAQGQGRLAQGETKRNVEKESLMLTGDENIVDIDFVVQWRIDTSRVQDYLFNIRDPGQTIARVAEGVMREVVGQRRIQSVIISERDAIAQQVRLQMQEILDGYGAGVIINEVNLEAADPPQGTTRLADGSTFSVIEAFNDVQRAATDNEREQNEARRYRNQILEEVEGQMNRYLAQAGAYAAQVTEMAQGESERFLSILSSYRDAPDVTRQRLYLETMEDVLAKSHKVIIDPQSATGAGGGGVVPYLPLDRLQGNRSSTSTVIRSQEGR